MRFGLPLLALVLPTITIACGGADSGEQGQAGQAATEAAAKPPSHDALNSAIVDSVKGRYSKKLPDGAGGNLPDSIHCGDTDLTGFAKLNLVTDATGDQILLDTTDGDQVSGFFFQKSDLQALAAKQVAVISVKEYSGYWWSDGDHYTFEDSACKLTGSTDRTAKVAPNDALNSAIVDSVTEQYTRKLDPTVASKLPTAIRCSGSSTLKDFPSLKLTTDPNGAQIVLDTTDGDQVSGFFFQTSDLEALATKKVSVIPAKPYSGYWWSDGDHYAFGDATCKLTK